MLKSGPSDYRLNGRSARLKDVADEAGFSKGGLLYYYATKEDLYMDLIDDYFSEMERDHAAVIRGNLHSDEKASISALFVIEKLVLDRKNVRIFINLVLGAVQALDKIPQPWEKIEISLQAGKK